MLTVALILSATLFVWSARKIWQPQHAPRALRMLPPGELRDHDERNYNGTPFAPGEIEPARKRASLPEPGVEYAASSLVAPIDMSDHARRDRPVATSIPGPGIKRHG